MIAAIFLPAIFILLSALWFFLAVADGLERIGANAVANQRLLGRVSATLTQRQIVLGGTAVVAVAFNLDLPALLLDDLCRLRQCLLRVGTQISLVVVEVNILYHLGKKLIVGDCRRWRGRWCRSCPRGHRNLCRGFLRSRSALRGQMVGSSLRRRDGL